MDSKDKIEELEQKLVKLEKSLDGEPEAVGKTFQFSHSAYANTGNDISLALLIKGIWQGKVTIIATSFLFAVLAVFYALSLPNIYRSDALLMPNFQEQTSGGLGGLSGQIGGLASLAGISLGGGNSDKVGYALEVIKSREFLYDFIERQDLKKAIMATEAWQRGTDTFVYDETIYDTNSNKWVREVKAPYQPEPSLQETYEKFVTEHFSVSQNEDSGMVRISVYHYSPYLAKQLVEILVEEINKTVKDQDLDEATKSISFIEQELQNTKDSGMRTMFYQLIEQQLQTLMLAKVRDDYVLKAIDRAVVAEEKYKPHRAIIVILWTLFGGFISTIVVLYRFLKVEVGE